MVDGLQGPRKLRGYTKMFISGGTYNVGDLAEALHTASHANTKAYTYHALYIYTYNVQINST